ncbi:hypothetical protein [Falsiroseomonas oryzae]|uniref:hypothetical protein n=1 Tax=Falsiroseomonas oryzae TaxID=2766473 RepID=UPI0022EA50C7|nr:hypothetical protein [Roseomonas sp. MO-31]
MPRAFRYQRLLDEGRYASITEMPKGENINRGYLGRLLQLTTLAPDLVEDILNGRQGPSVTLPRLFGQFPERWREQNAKLQTLRSDP